MEIRPLGAELFHADRHDEANNQSLFAILQRRQKTDNRQVSSSSSICMLWTFKTPCIAG